MGKWYYESDGGMYWNGSTFSVGRTYHYAIHSETGERRDFDSAREARAWVKEQNGE